MTTKPPIGLSGFARSGKTTAAQYLESEYGYTRLHIADPLRRMLSSLLTDFGYSGHKIWQYLEGPLKENVIPELGVTSRHAQISLGTEWGREQIHPDLWQRCWEAQQQRLNSPAMNDSVRFPNEEAGIRGRGGFTILIVRPECGPAAFKSAFGKWLYQMFGLMHGVHDSERVDRLNPNYVIHNTGSVEDLYRMLDLVMQFENDDIVYPTMHIRPEDIGAVLR